MKRVILVGGGTAGHVEPAIAVGKWLESHDSQISCEFVGTRHGIEMDLIPHTGWRFHKITKAPMPRKLGFGLVGWLLKVKVSFWQSIKLLRGAELVIGFGGYVSAPVYLAAKVLRIPIIIHEANAKPGWANRLGSKLTKDVTIAFAGSKSAGKAWQEAELVGMPIRSDIVAIHSISQSDRSKVRESVLNSMDLNPDNPTLFIFGGSLGATRLNDVIRQALPKVLTSGVNVIHAVGKKNQLPLKITGYSPISYVDDMASIYLASDLIISRSGAVSCAEIAASGRYALLVPLPIGNGEQEANAMDLVAAGAAQIVKNEEFTADWLTSNLMELLQKASGSKSYPINEKLLHADALIGEMALRKLVKVSS